MKIDTLILAAGALALAFALGVYAGQSTCAAPTPKPIAKTHILT